MDEREYHAAWKRYPGNNEMMRAYWRKWVETKTLPGPDPKHHRYGPTKGAQRRCIKRTNIWDRWEMMYGDHTKRGREYQSEQEYRRPLGDRHTQIP